MGSTIGKLIESNLADYYHLIFTKKKKKILYIFMLYLYKRKLHSCTMTFTLITNLTTDFEKCSVLPSHLKKRTPKYPDSLLPK